MLRTKTGSALLGCCLLLGAVSCRKDQGGGGTATGGKGPAGVPAKGGDDAARLAALGKKPIVPPIAAERAPAPAPRLAEPTGEAGAALDLVGKIRSHFDRSVGRRLYIQVDKPMYKPGETIWIKTWDLRARDLGGAGAVAGIAYELVSPKGSVVLSKRVGAAAGLATNDFEIPEGVQGGEYLVRVRRLGGGGESAERPVIVSSYEAPRIKMKLEFVRKAYGAGDEVSATIEARRATGEPLGKHPLAGLPRLDGQDLPRVALVTDAAGDGVVKFKLPADIAAGDGILTVLAEDGGVTESVSRRIPIIVKKLQLAIFPEGGDLVTGLPSRVYLEARNPIGKPADVEGRIVDDVGNTAARFATVRDGLGRTEIVPATGRRYEVVIDRPVGVSERYALPAPAEKGCVLRSIDDLDGELPALRVAVRCSEKRSVRVVGMLRDNLIDVAHVQASPSDPTVVFLEAKQPGLGRAQGVARVTVLGDKGEPLAERLVYRNRRARLDVKVAPHKPAYSPRDQVTLAVRTSDPAGNPVPAEIALSVVDDTVVSLADDKTGHMLSRLLLEPEFPGKVEEPNFYLDLTEAKSALALDLLMGTRGYRRFEWAPVLDPPPAPPPASVATRAAIEKGGILNVLGAAGENDIAKVLEGMGGIAGDQLKGAEGIGGLGLRGIGAGGMGKGMARGGGAGLAAGPVGMRRALAPARAPAPAAKMPAAPPPRPAAEPAVRAEAKRMNRQDGAKKEAAKEMAVQAAKPMGILGVIGQRNRAANAFADAEVAEEAVGLGAVAAREAPAADKDWAAAAGDKQKAEEGRMAPRWAPVRVFPAPTYGGDFAGARTDFRETIHWQPSVKTGKDGTATVTFYLSDAVTSFRVSSEGAGGGFAGRDETVVKSSLPFSLSAKLPVEVSAGDRIDLPLTLTNERDRPLALTLETSFGQLVTLAEPVQAPTSLAAGARQSLFYSLTVGRTPGKSAVRLAAQGGGLGDEMERSLEVVPLGFPQVVARSGDLRGQQNARHEIDLGQATEGSARLLVKLYPSPVSNMVSGLDALLREPGGCFEQTSSNNYPNVMVMQYLKQNNVSDAKLLARSSQLLTSGYQKLAGFESKSKGYEWFGGDPGHEALTAYGLVEFVDMKGVHDDVDDQMIRRTAEWLRSRRDGKGGYRRDPKALDSFGRASPEVTNAYITYSLTEARQTDIPEELALSARVARESQDAYLLALAANTLLNVPARKNEGVAAARRLAGMQEANGSWIKASHSITRSGGQNLTIETTSLAILALIDAGGFNAEVRRGVEWLVGNRGGFGQWGATQATVLALKAMTAYAAATAKAPSPGTVTVLVNGKSAGRMDYQAGRREPIEITADASLFTAGANQVEIRHAGRGELPYSLALEYRSARPASDPATVIGLATTLGKSEVAMGETVRLDAVITNKTQQGQGMVLARVGIPGGLAFQTWQLKELRDKGTIAFYETRPREVIVYLREMAPGAEVKVPVELKAEVPGQYTAPASSAYLYYDDEHRTWVDPVRIAVKR